MGPSVTFGMEKCHPWLDCPIYLKTANYQVIFHQTQVIIHHTHALFHHSQVHLPFFCPKCHQSTQLLLAPISTVLKLLTSIFLCKYSTVGSWKYFFIFKKILSVPKFDLTKVSKFSKLIFFRSYLDGTNFFTFFLKIFPAAHCIFVLAQKI